MVPKLYAATETAFTSEGLGRLTDATRCEVTEERNGEYELVLDYPVSGEMLKKIQVGCYIAATHDDDQDLQPFEIYKVSAPIRGVVTVNAWHISYKLNSVAVLPFTADSCANALAAIGTNSLNTNPFTFWTDKAVTAPFELTVPKNARNILGGEAGSILDVYGKGEYEFDKYTVKLWTNRGSDNGVEIRYGKNLTALDYQQNGASVYNAVAPFWTNDSTTVYLDHLVVRTGETAGNAIALDLSGEFDEEPTAAQLEAAAQAYIDGSESYTVKENIKIDFVPIWQTEDYRNAARTERVKLCDTVTVIFEGYNIRAKAKAIKVVYDTLRDRYKYIELGEPKATFAQEVTAIVSDNIMGNVEGLVKRTAADAIPDASATERGLVNTDQQVLRGIKVFDSEAINIANGGVRDTVNRSQLQFADKTFSSSPDTGTGTRAAAIMSIRDNVGSSLGNKMRLGVRSPKSDGTGYTGNYDYFDLPEPITDKAQTDYYEILTTKAPVTVAQGGTGATDMVDARVNLGLKIAYSAVTNGGTTRYTISPNSRHFVLVIGSGVTNNYAVFLFACTSTGSATQRQVAKGSGVTVTTSGTTISITSSGAAATVMDWAISGDNLEVQA